jgi:energy-coupling factor transporter ATP-binding protein EcfA2
MDIDVTLSGYRCFSPNYPVTLSLRGDTVALIGVNNSGKSTLLKSVYELRPLFQFFGSGQPSQLGSSLPAGSFKRPAEVADLTDLFWHFGESDLVVEILLPELKTQERNELAWKAQLRLPRAGNAWKLTFFDEGGNPINANVGTNPRGIFVGDKRVNEMCDAFKVLAECRYVPSVRHVTSYSPDAGLAAEGWYFDIYTGKPFVEAWANRQQGPSKPQNQAIREITNDIKQLFRYDDLEIHADHTGRELQVVADGKSLRLAELGTGLAQFVLLLGNIAFAKPSYVFIDEPENNLHPSLQLQFMQSIAARCGSGVVFATHSLGLARQAADRIFALTRNVDHCEMTRLEDTQDLARLVGELSFGRADSAGARGLLLVEGPTDVMTFEGLLAALNKENHFAILSLGGSGNINGNRERELEHIIAINPNVVAIIDSEKSSPEDPLNEQRKNFIAICQKLAIRHHVLEFRAIENYFPQRAITAIFPNHQYHALEPYGSRDGARQWWPKKHNWKIARAMKKSEVESTDIGQFLGSL